MFRIIVIIIVLTFSAIHAGEMQRIKSSSTATNKMSFNKSKETIHKKRKQKKRLNFKKKTEKAKVTYQKQKRRRL